MIKEYKRAITQTEHQKIAFQQVILYSDHWGSAIKINRLWGELRTAQGIIDDLKHPINEKRSKMMEL